MKIGIVLDGDKERERFNMYWRADRMDNVIREWDKLLRHWLNRAENPHTEEVVALWEQLVKKNNVDGLIKVGN